MSETSGRRPERHAWAPFAACACLSLATMPVLAADLPPARITGYGRYTVERDGPLQDLPAGGTGVTSYAPSQGARLVETTTRIEARLCLRFGVMFTVDGLGPTDTLALTARSEHPPMLHPDGRVSTGATYALQADGSRPSLVGFAFDDPWELAPGPWIFAVMLGGTVLAEQRFDVVVPAGASRTSRARCSSVVS